MLNLPEAAAAGIAREEAVKRDTSKQPPSGMCSRRPRMRETAENGEESLQLQPVLGLSR